MIKKFFLFFYILSIGNLASADALEENTSRKWTKSKKDTLAVSMGLLNTDLGLEWQEKDNRAPILFYKTNKQPHIFLNLSYRSFALSVSFLDLNHTLNPDKYGETSATDYQFRFYGDRWTPEFFYQKYKGYHLNNHNQLGVAATNSHETYYRPDIGLEHWGTNLYYNLNPSNYTLAGNFNLSNKQIESGGSWFVLGGFNQYNLDADQPIIPSTVAGYGSSLEITKINSTVLSLGFGGAYNYVFNNFFLGGMLGISLDHVNNKITLVTAPQLTENANGNRFHIRGSLGHNGDQFFTFMSIINDGQSLTAMSSRVLYDVSEVRLTFGWRFENIRFSSVDNVHDNYLP